MTRTIVLDRCGTIVQAFSNTTPEAAMKQPRDFIDDNLTGRRVAGVVIAALASAVILWSANELFDLLLASAKAMP